MRRLFTGSLGLGIALSAAAGRAADPYPFTTPTPVTTSPVATTRPAARLVGIRPMMDADAAAGTAAPRLMARSQAADGVPMPMPMPPGVPMGGAPVGGPQQGSTPLPGPRSFGQGPNVTELRNGAPTAPPPAASFAPPPAGVPIGVPYTPAGVPLGAADGGLFPAPDLDAPLFGAPGPHGVAAATSAYNRWYVSGEYLLWWTNSATLPILLTTSPPASNGILGQPGTQVLLGNNGFSQNLHSGARFGAGYWFGCDQRWGFDGSVFFLGRNTQNYNVDTGTVGVIARPFNNLNSNIPFSEIVASPGLATGGAGVHLENSVWGAEANLRRFLAKTCCARLDLIGGFRYLQFNERLQIDEFFARTPNSPTSIGVPTAVSGTVQDQFWTKNQFYGGQLGLLGELRRGRWFGTLSGKVAFGTVFQTVDINGRQNIQFADGTSTSTPGGLLAVPGANIGTTTQSKFAVVPEVGLNIGYHLTPHCRVFLGYNFLYLSSVLRPGDQIDPGLDVTRIPNFPVPGATPLPQVRPIVPLRERDFYAQGISFGIQFTW